MALNFTGTATTTPATLTVSGAAVFRVYCKNTGGTNNLEVNIPALHGSGDYATVAPGDVVEFETTRSIGSVNVQSDASTTDYIINTTRASQT